MTHRLARAAAAWAHLITYDLDWSDAGLWSESWRGMSPEWVERERLALRDELANAVADLAVLLGEAQLGAHPGLGESPIDVSIRVARLLQNGIRDVSTILASVLEEHGEVLLSAEHTELGEQSRR